MKNMSIRLKLLLLSIPATIVLILFSVASIYFLNSVNNNTTTTLYDNLYIPTTALLNADRDFYQAYVAEEEILLLQKQKDTTDKQAALVNDFKDNAEQVQTRLNTAYSQIQNNTDLYEVFLHPEAQVTLKQLQEQFNQSYNQWISDYDPDTGKGNYEEHIAAFNAARENINIMTETLDAYAQNSTAEIGSHIKNLTRISVVAVILIVLLLVLLSIIVIRYLRKSIQYITGISTRIAQGELTLSIDKKYFTKDEVGQLSQAMGQILKRLGEYYNYIREITSVLETMKQGDMTIHLTQAYEGEFASIKTALLGISSSLNQTLSLIDTAAEQVNTGAFQVAGGAQALASGSVQQAASVQELDASISVVADQAIDSSSNVKMATGYVQNVDEGLNAANMQMEQLTQAMEDIAEASDQITGIIKMITNIAFQTNILALNASIEASRAGSEGKGFAVVADEVRELAAKSSEAAKQTAELIQSSVESVSNGKQLTAKTAEILKDIAEKSTLVTESIMRIDNASTEQVTAIEEIKKGLSQVSSVVQTNAATAEENSATSEEMSAQAATLREEVGKFKLTSADKEDQMIAENPSDLQPALAVTAAGPEKY